MRYTKYEFAPINMTEYKYSVATVPLMRAGVTSGQAFMWVLMDTRPEIYKKIYGTKYDPSYDDSRIDSFIEVLYVGVLYLPNEDGEATPDGGNSAIQKLKNDVKQNIHNIKKCGLYTGDLKESLLYLKNTLEDY